MSLAGFQQQFTGFQGGTTGFQQTFFSGGSGAGGGYKLDSAAFAEVYSNFRNTHKSELENVPQKVVEVIKKAAVVDDGKKAREYAIKSRLDTLELKYRREWLRLSTELHEALKKRQALEIKRLKTKKRRQSDELAITLLLM